jgi:hypothetical protein
MKDEERNKNKTNKQKQSAGNENKKNKKECAKRMKKSFPHLPFLPSWDQHKEIQMKSENEGETNRRHNRETILRPGEEKLEE